MIGRDLGTRAPISPFVGHGQTRNVGYVDLGLSVFVDLQCVDFVIRYTNTE